MATLAVSPLRVARTPGRPRRNHSITEAATEPPHKKRKYIPGGPGGGGRYIDGEGKEQAVGGTGPGGYAYSGPRGRAGRLQLEDGVKMAEEAEAETPAVARSAMQTRPRRERPERYAPQPTTPRPRYSSAAAAAAASQASDGYKPREERSWEDFHPDLEIGASLQIFTADEVDGRNGKKGPKLLQRGSSAGGDARPVLHGGDVEMKDADSVPESQEIVVTPVKRKPGRPPRRPESMLHGLGSPPAPRILPLPTHNPKERLNLPKPSFRHFNHFLQYEENQLENKKNYVDRTMSNVGYQESDRFELPSKVLVRLTDSGQAEDEAEVSLRLASDGPAEVPQAAPVVGKVEYDMDEQDVAWLEEMNESRRSEGVEAIKPAIFEITMTQIEKEYHALEKRIPKPQPRHAQMHRPRSSSQAAVNGDPNPPGDEPDSKCAICDDGDCENANAIIFCDGCDLAVHQECYGVPFIPEGQWFCRKCKEIGRGTPTCIFCPNVDGAFKQTNTLRWSHLLCAIWIPEVTVANMTFMEPITDVEKVPKSRWKLLCYICNQKMGACIQCGNKNCYQAFHVSCARRAKLFLKMKSQHQQGIDTTALKAFCDKHVPPEWRRTHDTDTAIVEAKRWYRHAMKDRRWADSQTAALDLGAPPPADGGLAGETGADDTIAVTKRRKNAPPKMSWRLPSGAPVVPQVVFDTVEASLVRFTVRKRKEFVDRVCRYWTLKREARRGAALLKRLQLQLESFSSMEITRRNFAGMGAAGRPRLQRRIEFAEMLQKDMAHLTEMCAAVREREELRLRELEILRELVNSVYFPIPALLEPILLKARKLDEKTQYFKSGLDRMALQIRERYFTSAQDFSQELTRIIAEPLAPDANDTAADMNAISSRLNEAKPGTADYAAMSQEQKEIKKNAKRILKAVKEPLEDALRKEAELKGREMEEEIRKLDAMGMFASATKALAVDGQRMEEASPTKRRNGSDVSAAAGASPEDVDADVEMADADEHLDEVAVVHLSLAKDPQDNDNDTIAIPTKNKHKRNKSTPASEGVPSRASSSSAPQKPATEPLSPPISNTSSSAINPATNSTDVFASGGIPWYLEPFDPLGTTVHEERYTGRAVLRDMSEELSDMDEDTLTELAGSGVVEESTPVIGTPQGAGNGKGGGGGNKKAAKAKKRTKRRLYSGRVR
ncbi:hypothetical protein LTR37_019226 [Vermiconidia calcicola]|uniref:Uncharacterized protein n=1 Tax=Vermiconidia calcicola TaxID=1690605 RepID=A0ACC3MF13_9PEZI|nr:hypothetical protein LTR37_019226 [Vermiconidia calcicola]